MKFIQLYIGENVDQMVATEGTNYIHVLGSFSERSWVMHVQRYEGNKYGSRTTRGRQWIVAANYKRLRMSKDPAQKLVKDVHSFAEAKLQLEPEPLDSVLEADGLNSEYVRQFEAELLAQKRAAGKEDTGWQGRFVETMAQHNVRWSECVVPAAHQASPHYPLLTDRAKAVLAFNMMRHPEACGWDVSQEAHRAFSCHDDLFCTITPR
eukprot:14219733-Alexandrium_andersonii.AAC.1